MRLCAFETPKSFVETLALSLEVREAAGNSFGSYQRGIGSWPLGVDEMGRKRYKEKTTRDRTLRITVQFSSVAQSCPTLCDPMNHSTPGLPVHHQVPEFIQTHVHWVGDAIQPSYPLSSPSPPAFSLSQHQGLFKWVSSSHQVAKVLEFQLQHQSFQWTLRTDFL